MKQKDLDRLIEINDDIHDIGWHLENSLDLKTSEEINEYGIELQKINKELQAILIPYKSAKTTRKMIKEYCKATTEKEKQEILNKF